MLSQHSGATPEVTFCHNLIESSQDSHVNISVKKLHGDKLLVRATERRKIRSFCIQPPRVKLLFVHVASRVDIYDFRF